MKFSDTFEKLNGRPATPSEVLKFERLVELLETTPNDTFLAVLVALGHHETLFLQIPGMIVEATNGVLNNVNQTADKAMAAAAGKATEALAKAVSDTAIDVANNTSKKQMWKWAAGCITVAFIALGGFGWFCQDMGYKAGIGDGYSQAKDEKSAASWANTSEGKIAYKLAQTSTFHNLVHCDKQGWYVKDGVCFIAAFDLNGESKINGWILP
jgi:hypothetical protein